MSQYSKALDDVRVLAKKFQGIIELAKALEEVDKLENVAKEAEGLKIKAQGELAAVKEQIEKSKGDLEVVESAIKYADAKAEKIVEAANVKGNSIVDEAIAESKKLFDDVEKKKKLFDDQFVAAGKELASLQADIELKKQELESIKKEKEAVKQQFAALLK